MFSDTTRSSGPENPNRISRTGVSIIFIVQAFKDEGRDLADGGSDHRTGGLTRNLKLVMQMAQGQPDPRGISVSVSVSLQGASHREPAFGGMWLSMPCSLAFLCLYELSCASDGETPGYNDDL
jgi:hypothetical protein